MIWKLAVLAMVTAGTLGCSGPSAKEAEVGERRVPAAKLAEARSTPENTQGPRFGVVTWESDGSACATFAEEVAEGTSFKIAVFDPDRTIDGSIVRRSDKPCRDSASVSGASYVVASSSRESATGVGVAMLQPRENIRTRMCASTEGLHLTAWEDGRRVWHTYYYLGYDLDPDCTEEESKE